MNMKTEEKCIVFEEVKLSDIDPSLMMDKKNILY